MKFGKLSPSSPPWLKDISAFTGWFSEKGTQVEPSCLTAFGISLDSRYGKAGEIRSMLAFAETVARAGVAGYIASVFYDSKACICRYELRGTALLPVCRAGNHPRMRAHDLASVRGSRGHLPSW